MISWSYIYIYRGRRIKYSFSVCIFISILFIPRVATFQFRTCFSASQLKILPSSAALYDARTNARMRITNIFGIDSVAKVRDASLVVVIQRHQAAFLNILSSTLCASASGRLFSIQILDFSGVLFMRPVCTSAPLRSSGCGSAGWSLLRSTADWWRASYRVGQKLSLYPGSLTWKS